MGIEDEPLVLLKHIAQRRIGVEERLNDVLAFLYAHGDAFHRQHVLEAEGSAAVACQEVDRLGGHFVLGHVDCAAVVHEIRELGSSRELWVAFPEAFSPFIVSAGSITIDGISLTVARLDALLFAVAIIPYTFAHTTLHSLHTGSRVNLEFDILGKYVARQLAAPSSSALPPSRIDDLWLREHGF